MATGVIVHSVHRRMANLPPFCQLLSCRREPLAVMADADRLRGRLHDTGVTRDPTVTVQRTAQAGKRNRKCRPERVHAAASRAAHAYKLQIASGGPGTPNQSGP